MTYLGERVLDHYVTLRREAHGAVHPPSTVRGGP